MSDKWDSFVLLLIDAQKDFWPESTAKAFPDFPQNMQNLLKVVREQGIDVLHLRAKFKRDRSDWMSRYSFIERRLPCIEGSTGVEVLPWALEEPGEGLIYKQSFDGFCNPELQSYLENRKKRFILIAGLVTSVCVLLTAASAAQRGYLVGIVEDCCADGPLMHETVLDNYPFIFDRVTVKHLLSRLPVWQEQVETV